MQRHWLFERLRRLFPRSSPATVYWGGRIALWTLCGYVIRYVYYTNFAQATENALWILSVMLLAQTIALYYAFGYRIFPETIYKRRIGVFLLWLVFWHAIIYQCNYWLFYLLQYHGETGMVSTYMKLLNSWGGGWAFITNGAAVFWNLFWSFAIASLLLTVKAITDLINLRTRTIQLEKDKLALELDFLKAQVNPHFLFNTLNSIYARIFDTDEQAADLLLRLSELMRYNLYETNQPLIELSKELAYIANYLDLERNRLMGQHVVIDYQQSGAAESYQIAPLLLIAFVENAFKHGVKGASKKAFVRVQADVAQEQLVFTVENSVFPKRQVNGDTVKRSGGIGLVNVQRRLDSIYLNRYELTVASTELNYSVRIKIQL
ncbi:sensor histidine kinase [Fibrella aquatilis]|uniref:Histidine kinase n=1 Tax=Fibrella aquatilis TaxID=2817059 RepID=A0A939G6K3_9BACT|nr:histidine kinase [Fibrella aquatilis]MBO0932143.1 histidine kinase [Fibrella aquatilis]